MELDGPLPRASQITPRDTLTIQAPVETSPISHQNWASDQHCPKHWLMVPPPQLDPLEKHTSPKPACILHAPLYPYWGPLASISSSQSRSVCKAQRRADFSILLIKSKYRAEKKGEIQPWACSMSHKWRMLYLCQEVKAIKATRELGQSPTWWCHMRTSSCSSTAWVQDWWSPVDQEETLATLGASQGGGQRKNELWSHDFSQAYQVTQLPFILRERLPEKDTRI